MARITAYEVGNTKGWVLEPMERRRDWMEQTPEKAAHRCLPLVIANQAGWVIRCPARFKVTWNGRKDADGLSFEFPERSEQMATQVRSLFGLGIVSFSLPWLFRTSEGLATIVRGPTNWAKDHIVPLDGIVETDWLAFTFTMNWRITKAKQPIWFRRGDPICMLIPYPLKLLQELETEVAPISANPELEDQFAAAGRVRRDQYRRLGEGQDPQKLFQLDYVRGAKPDGTFAEAHYSKLSLKPFEGTES